jgi:hypothetical protein
MEIKILRIMHFNRIIWSSDQEFKNVYSIIHALLQSLAIGQ